MKKYFLISLTALVFLGLMTSGPAIAATPWINPGTICHNKQHGQTHLFNYQANGIVNNSFVIRRISCPIITQNSTLGSPGTVYVMYTSSVDTTCTLYTHNWFVRSLIVTQNVKLPAGGTGFVNINHVPNDNFYQHTLECDLPSSKRVKIRGIEVFF